MNIFNLLTIKTNVCYLLNDMTISEALEDINKNGYTAVPIIDHDGRYVATVTEGDFLRYIYNCDFNSGPLHENTLEDLPIRRDVRAVHVTAALNDLVEKAKAQNFVPVVDDREMFIGIVTRKDLIVYACKNIIETKETK